MTLRRAVRRQLRRLVASGPLEPLAWRVRARRRARARARDTRVKPLLYDRLARIATPSELRALDDEVHALAGSTAPVTFAAWDGSLEDELLYWIPFLTWAVEAADLRPEDCVALARRGTEPWYANVASAVAEPGGVHAEASLGPAHLEQLRADYLAGTGPIVHVLERLRFRRLPAAVDGGEGIALWRGRSLASLPLAPGTVELDDDPATLTRHVGAAALLVGEASGPIHLGPMLGTPTVAIAEDPSPHVDLAQRAAHAYDTTFVVTATASLPMTARLAAAVGDAR